MARYSKRDSESTFLSEEVDKMTLDSAGETLLAKVPITGRIWKHKFLRYVKKMGIPNNPDTRVLILSGKSTLILKSYCFEGN